MSSNESPPNAGYPGQPGPGFMLPPGQGYLGQNPPAPTLGMHSTSCPKNPTRNQANDNEEKLRLGFIRKVNPLLTSQLFFIFGIVVFNFFPKLILTFGIIFTGAASVLIGATLTRFQKHELLLGIGITIVLRSLWSLLAFQITFDFWNFAPQLHKLILFCMIGLLFFGIITKFFLSHTRLIIYDTVGVIIFLLLFGYLGVIIFLFYLTFTIQAPIT